MKSMTSKKLSLQDQVMAFGVWVSAKTMAVVLIVMFGQTDWSWPKVIGLGILVIEVCDFVARYTTAKIQA